MRTKGQHKASIIKISMAIALHHKITAGCSRPGRNQKLNIIPVHGKKIMGPAKSKPKKEFLVKIKAKSKMTPASIIEKIFDRNLSMFTAWCS
jgi:hypothetical protein